MSQVINTNIMSLTTQNNLNKSQSALATAMQRLSSGLRINSSADDAAGFAISTRMTTQINGLDTATRNANDAVSLAQTASAALQQITDNLQAIRQLAVQSANATNSDSDRAALDQEVQQRLDEITRVAQQTTFNGRHILDGSFGTAAFQVGANVGDTISIDLSKGTGASQIGGVATASKDVSADFLSTAAAATGASVTSSQLTGFDFSTNNASFDVDGHTVSLTTNLTNQAGVVSAVQTALDSAAAGTYTVSADGAAGFKITTIATGASAYVAISNMTATNGLSFGTPVAGTDAVTAGQPTSLTLGSGELSINGTDITGTFADVQALADGINAAGIQGVSAYKGDDGSLVVQSNGTAASGDSITFGGSSALATAFGTTAYADTNSLADTDGSGDVMNVKTIAGANDSINRIDAALASVSSIDSQLGAMQNRFNSAITSAQAVSQNLSASRSRIQDADFAAETAAMSQAQILQQAGVSMLAQANAQPQLVLKLLQ